jgi:hypothetical protein
VKDCEGGKECEGLRAGEGNVKDCEGEEVLGCIAEGGLPHLH